MRIALAQINPKIGDLKGNVSLIINYINKARANGAELVVFPELSITGYPPRDLLDYDIFVKDNIEKLNEIKKYSDNIGILVGYVDFNEEPTGRKYRNAAALIHKGEIISKHYKTLLPFYDVFDETRYFEPGTENKPVEFLGKKLGITICEDMWNDKDYWKKLPYKENPIEELAKHDLDCIINLSASPFWLNKEKDRFNILKNIAMTYKTPIVYVNQVGANDDLLFDGVSMAIDKNGDLKARCGDFKDDLVVYSLNTNIGEVHKISDSEEKCLFKALRAGLKDYCVKSGFSKVVVGLSGGIDSAVVAAVASYAVGSQNVIGITMPSMYSSSGSVTDSEKLAKNLGIELINIPITNIFNSYIQSIQPGKGVLMDLAEENLQARIRGDILMAFSNRYNYLLISTGNKSEMAMGYCTLYGDMSGGLALISDVPKTMVYKLAEFINFSTEIIPMSIIRKPPSAELRPDQKDIDSLPPYEILDEILKEYVEENRSPFEIAQKYNDYLVDSIVKKVNASEHKRRQAPPGIKITTKAFGTGRRFPIVQGYDFNIQSRY